VSDALVQRVQSLELVYGQGRGYSRVFQADSILVALWNELGLVEGGWGGQWGVWVYAGVAEVGVCPEVGVGSAGSQPTVTRSAHASVTGHMAPRLRLVAARSVAVVNG